MYAEQAYLFRHTMLCSAAYDLQLPGQRARLHALALRIMEAVLEVSAPAPTNDPSEDGKYIRHPCDPYAAELAFHAARAAAVLPYSSLRETRRREACYLKRAAEFAANEFQHLEAARIWQQLAEIKELDADRRAEAWRRAAKSLDAGGHSSRSLDLVGRSAEVALELAGDERQRMTRAALAQKGLAQVHLGRIDEARQNFEGARKLAAETGDAKTQGQCLRNIANVLIATGQVKEALRVARQALEFATQAGDLHSETIIKGNIGNMLLESGDVAGAEEFMRDSLRAARELGDKQFEALVVGNLESLLDELGNLEGSRSHYMEALELARSTGDRLNQGVLLGNLAGLLQKTHRNREAMEGFYEALAIAQEIGDRADEGLSLGNLGACELELNRLDAAENHFLQAAEIAREVQEPRFEGAWLCYLGCTYTLMKRFDEAETNWAAGALILSELNDPFYYPTLKRNYNSYRQKVGLPPLQEEA